MWTLGELVPSADDWRTRLPAEYWDRLARYQSVQRALIAAAPTDRNIQTLKSEAASLEQRLEEFEADAAGPSRSGVAKPDSSLAHVQKVLDGATVLFSFHITDSAGWLWAVDRSGVSLYPIPTSPGFRNTIECFTAKLRSGDVSAAADGERLYRQLFGTVAGRYLSHARWLLELDGPLFDLPFGALIAGYRSTLQNEPIYLGERKVLQLIPGAAMIQRRTSSVEGTFLGIGDPVYNAADARYSGPRHTKNPMLARLPATAQEVESCSRTWNPRDAKVLTGARARLESVRAAIDANPAIIHFATHILPGAGQHSSGLIALGLDNDGTMGVMGPAEIVARRVSASLVVLNGCHSAQSESVPGVGLMGLTRAWIGAGARSVVATQWDISDEGAAGMMVEFYRVLRANPAGGPAYALQQSQIMMKHYGKNPAQPAWAAYFVMGTEF